MHEPRMCVIAPRPSGDFTRDTAAWNKMVHGLREAGYQITELLMPVLFTDRDEVYEIEPIQ